MSLLDYLRGKRKSTASVAKERLQIIISHERTQRGGPDFLGKLQQEIIDVIAKYIDIDRESVKVQLERAGDNSVLELSVSLPERAGALAE
jgi:cell division topological specificity factor